MAIRERLGLKFELETTQGKVLASMTPSISLGEVYQESLTLRYEVPADANFHEIQQGLVDTVTMVVLAAPSAFTVRLNDDPSLVIPAKDFWVYRSDTDLTKLEVRNDGPLSMLLRGFILGI